MNPAEVSLPSDLAIRIERTFHAPARLVWRAYTEPELLRRWMLGPPGWEMTICEMDVRVGGNYLWRWRSLGDGREFGFSGEFHEVTPHVRIIHTQVDYPGDFGSNMSDVTLVTVDFNEADGRTTMVSIMSYQSKQDRDTALETGMTDGMEMSYGQLDMLVQCRLELP